MGTAASVLPDAARESDRELQRWQNKLMRFMAGSLIAMGAIFFVATLWLFIDLTQRVEYRQTDLVAVMNALPRTPDAEADRTYREWYVRAVLEKSALEQRFALQSMVVQGRLWTRVMGFLTGMILCFSGCVFVLGKMREPLQAAAEATGINATLTTSSPGVFLAFAGALLIGLALYVPTSVESSDVAVYLPRQVEVVDPGPLAAGGGAEREPPAAIEPAPELSPPVGEQAPVLPETVTRKLRESAASGHSR